MKCDFENDDTVPAFAGAIGARVHARREPSAAHDALSGDDASPPARSSRDTARRGVVIISGR
jgi:hypothetical protein